MSRCKSCNESVTGKKQYCNDACRMAFGRRQPEQISQPEHEQPEQMQPEHPNPNKAYEMGTAGTFVYGRQAVLFPGDSWATRPIPLDPSDKPHAGGRGKFTRQDGTEYQFDCNGKAFDLTNGKIYQTTEDVKACYEEPEK